MRFSRDFVQDLAGTCARILPGFMPGISRDFAGIWLDFGQDLGGFLAGIWPTIAPGFGLVFAAILPGLRQHLFGISPAFGRVFPGNWTGFGRDLCQKFAETWPGFSRDLSGILLGCATRCSRV